MYERHDTPRHNEQAHEFKSTLGQSDPPRRAIAACLAASYIVRQTWLPRESGDAVRTNKEFYAMPEFVRKAFPYVTIVGGLIALAWAISFGTLPKADFSFANGDEVRTVDPAKASGQPEHRILNALFEGLLRQMPANVPPDENGVIPLEAVPGVAIALPEISTDGKTYTFHLRPEARWSNGDRVTAHDFAFSWQRTLHPETAAEYAYQLFYLQNGEQYNSGKVEKGDRVEVELKDRRDEIQPFPRGTIRRGVLRAIVQPPQPDIDPKASKEEKGRIESDWKREWIYLVEVAPKRSDSDDVDWDSPGKLTAYSIASKHKTLSHPFDDGVFDGPVEACHLILLDFQSQVGVKAVDDSTLVVNLKNSTPFFHELAAYYTLFPVHRATIEKHGAPYWTKPENMVCNGPYTMQFRRIRDRIRLVKNPTYWDAKNVHMDVIDAMAVKFETTQLNMFLSGQIDWATIVPRTVVPELQKMPEYHASPQLSTYFYRLNVARKPLDDVRVRRALNMAIDKRQITEHVTRAGEVPARSLVPPGLKGYRSSLGDDFDPAGAARLLAEAGFPDGKGMPKLEILYNTLDAHRSIAEVVQQNWQKHLGVEVELKNMEWGVYLDAQNKKDYQISRAGWIGDYPDPNTFLDMWVTDGGQNNTNWSNAAYDQLIADAAAELDSEKRMDIFHEAERLLMSEVPIIVFYFYVHPNLVNTRLEGFTNNIQDVHQLHLLRWKSPVTPSRQTVAQDTKK